MIKIQASVSRGRGSLAHSTIGHIAIAHRAIRHIKLRTVRLDTILWRTVRLDTVLLRTVQLDTVAFGHNTYTCIYASKELQIFGNLLLNLLFNFVNKRFLD